MKKNILDIFSNKTVFRITTVLLFIIAFVMVILAVIPVNFGEELYYVTEQTDTEISYSSDTSNKTEAVNVTGFTVSSDEALNNLIYNYYYSLTVNDDTILSRYTDEIENINGLIRYIAANYVESYTNIVSYSMPGMLDSTYIVVVRSDIKYKDIESVAPNIDYFYVCTDLSGNLYISNKAQGEDVTSYNQMMYESSIIVDLANRTAAEYDAAIKNDEALYNLFSGF